MRSLLSILIVLACSGCISSEQRERVTEEARLLAKYDRDALTVFVRKVVEAHPTITGVTLSTRIDGKWSLEPLGPFWLMRSGDWVFHDQHPDLDEFLVSSMTKEPPYAWITIYAKRIAKDRFEFVRLLREEVK